MNLSTLFWWLLAAMAAAGLYQYLTMSDQLRHLEAEGFRIDLRVEHNPLLVFDRQRQQGALIFSDHTERFNFNQVEALRWTDLAGSTQNPTPELRILLRDVSIKELRFTDQEPQLRQLQQQLTELLGRK
jgi:hypothetical protein